MGRSHFGIAALSGLMAVAASGTAAFERVSTGPLAGTFGTEPGGFTGHVRLTFGFDDNVAFVADNRIFYVGETGAVFVQLEATARYWYALSDTTRLGFVVSTFWRQYDDQEGGEVPGESLQSYSLGAIHPKVFLETEIASPLGPMTLTPSFSIRYEDGDDFVEALGVTSLQLAIDGRVDMGDDRALTFGALVTNDNYDVVFEGLPERDRDATYAEAYVGGRIPIGAFPPLDVALAVQSNASEGSDYAWTGVELRLDRSWALNDDLFGTVSLDYGWRDYETLAFTDLDPGGRGDTTVLNATVNGVYRLDDTRSVGAYASYLRADTGNDSFNVERTEFGINYTMLFQ